MIAIRVDHSPLIRIFVISVNLHAMITNRFLLVIGAIVVTTAFDLLAAEPAPGTPKKPVSTEYQGVTVEDPYQWLEKTTSLT